MRTKNYLYCLVVLIFVVTFFFSTIGVSVETPEGSRNLDEFIYGGTYWTSGLYEFGIGNNPFIVSYLLFFMVLTIGIKFLKSKED